MPAGCSAPSRRPRSRWPRWPPSTARARPAAPRAWGGAGGAGSSSGAAARVARGAAVAGGGGAGRATLVVRDGVREIVIRVDGVIAPPGSDYLEAWLMNPAGSGLISLGALARDGGGYRGTFTVPGDLPMDRFPTLDVSAERFDGDAAHSRESLLRGTLL
ncbi:MAG: anti-sigma factor [Pseudonocardia sp.]|nr:anti-sigma factor [Pseudonocardia sp.]